MLLSAFSERVQSCRVAKGLTQKEAASVFGVSERHWQSYEGGTRTPVFDRLVAMADFFGVSLDYLVGRSGDPTMR